MNTQLKKKPSPAPTIQVCHHLQGLNWTSRGLQKPGLTSPFLVPFWDIYTSLLDRSSSCCVGLFCHRIPPQLPLSWFESSLVLPLDQLLAVLLLLQINALLAHTYAHHLHIAYGCFPVTASWEAGQRPFGLKSLKHSLSGPLQRKSADPCLLENQLMYVFYVWLLFNKYCFYLSLCKTWFVFLVKN